MLMFVSEPRSNLCFFPFSIKQYFFPSKLSESRNQERINKNCFVVLGKVSV